MSSESFSASTHQGFTSQGEVSLAIYRRAVGGEEMLLVIGIILFIMAGGLYLVKALYDTKGDLESDWPTANRIVSLVFTLSGLAGLIFILIGAGT